MKVYLDKTKEYKNVKSKNIESILKELNINPITVFISVNKELVLNKNLKEKDIVIIYPVRYGG